jgi:hypothetical protein
VVDAVDNNGRTARDLAGESGRSRRHAIKTLNGKDPGFYIYEGRTIPY